MPLPIFKYHYEYMQRQGGVKFGRLMGEGKQAPARHGINFALMMARAK
jgi:hypothetical protein